MRSGDSWSEASLWRRLRGTYPRIERVSDDALAGYFGTSPGTTGPFSRPAPPAGCHWASWWDSYGEAISRSTPWALLCETQPQRCQGMVGSWNIWPPDAS